MIAELLALALAFAGLNAALSYILWTAPLPKRWKLLAYQLYSDAVIINVLVFSISLVQIAVTSISKMLSLNLSGPMQAPLVSFASIMLQLGSLLAGILSIIVLAASAGAGDAAGRILGFAGQIVVGDMILWSTIYLAIILVLKYWTLLYAIGIVFYSIPFRLARKVGSTIMASSCVLVICLPLLPDFALALEWIIGFQPTLESFLSTIQQPNPLAIIPAFWTVQVYRAIVQILAGMILALMIFPIIYLWILSKIIRRLSELIGGYARELDLARWIE